MPDPVTPPAASRPLPPRHEFDEAAYLYLHPDVAAAVQEGSVETGWQHFALHGFAEGRNWMRQADPLQGVFQEIAPGDEMYAANNFHYFAVGASALRSVETVLASARRPKETIRTILDLPCGHGRVMRFLRQAFPAAELTACDLNRDGMDYCARVFGAVPVPSHPDIELIPLQPDYYDLIWCGSLLTHLPATACAAFIHRFHRALKPGGILVFTTHGRQTERELTSRRKDYGLNAEGITALLTQYRQTGFGYADYPDQSGYGISLSLPSYVLAHFAQSPAWHLVGYHESLWDRRQDVVGLQRPWTVLAPSDGAAASPGR